MILVAAAVIYNNKKILIARRATGKHLAGYWEFPGGKIETDETPDECLTREIREELGISIRVDHFISENLHEYPGKIILLKAYRCTLTGGHICLVDHDDVRWIEPSALPEYRLAPADIPIATALISKIGGDQ